jgi:hypothetical protein
MDGQRESQAHQLRRSGGHRGYVASRTLPLLVVVLPSRLTVHSGAESSDVKIRKKTLRYNPVFVA